jgi:hypothetical protein
VGPDVDDMDSDRADNAGDRVGSMVVCCTSLGWSMKRQANDTQDTRASTRDCGQRLTVVAELEGYQAPDERADENQEKVQLSLSTRLSANCLRDSQAKVVSPARLAGNCHYNKLRR